MDRRAFVATLAGGLLAAQFDAEARQAGKVWRVGILATANPRVYDASIDELRTLGYIAGRPLDAEFRSAEGCTPSYVVLDTKSWMTDREMS
ncbi:MAG: hypothetical protein ACREA0_14975 [bacterium]